MRWMAFLLALVPANINAGEVKFEVSMKAGLIAKPTDGRIMVVMASGKNPMPIRGIGETGLDAPVFIGKDALAFTAGKSITLGSECPIFPIESLSRLPKGRYTIQAVFHHNLELNLPTAEGNVYSMPKEIDIDPVAGANIPIELSQVVPVDAPQESERIKYVKIKSAALSKFHGRDMYLRAGVCLPPDFDKNPQKKYPLLVTIGGYGTRYTAIQRYSRASIPMLILHVDGAGPYGDPYYVDSDCNGPYGKALTEELIPYVEKMFQGIGAGYARFTTGASTGGWVSLALQIEYPDLFNGCWSFAPDPVDFRAFELINIYQDENAYINKHGFERPAKRELNGETSYTVRHECQMEVVMGRNDSWWRSGKDWCAWNATFGPRGADGQPKPLWDGKTGKIDKSVLQAWKKNELNTILTEGWPTKHARWGGKIHVYVGDADDYFLNNAVKYMEASTKKFNPPFDGVIVTGPYQGHGFHPISNAEMIRQMIDRFEKSKK
ncbi:hypothetical protein KIH39_13245 [Telmatocola sphagniphila]|uniref:Esterase n=1 Tax=Telmatocola sphagniphila TaxID=1123043 RepID=A0A8E6B238_9BACT|nr:alpha/beta hydrolase-fold protein [Telmatocola sphagniphila]QVL29837.1 hypothetical protein KIH39_13245 [Telmatocola sphagniphila]